MTVVEGELREQRVKLVKQQTVKMRLCICKNPKDSLSQKTDLPQSLLPKKWLEKLLSLV